MSKDMETDLKAIAKTFSYAAANYKKVILTVCVTTVQLRHFSVIILGENGGIPSMFSPKSLVECLSMGLIVSLSMNLTLIMHSVFIITYQCSV